MSGNLVLCGFMGCGKTTVGKQTAKLLGLPFVDLDEYIEEKEGMKISEIFEEFGEAAFRQKENEAVSEIAKKGGMVVACGGGTVLNPKNVEEFHKNGSVLVLLYVPLSLLQRRLKTDTQRPLLQKPNRNQVIAELYKKRIPQYRRAADVTVRSTHSPLTIAKKLALLYSHTFDENTAKQAKSQENS